MDEKNIDSSYIYYSLFDNFGIYWENGLGVALNISQIIISILLPPLTHL